MTAKQKAEELTRKYWGKYCKEDDVNDYTICWHLAKECAAVAVDEILRVPELGLTLLNLA